MGSLQEEHNHEYLPALGSPGANNAAIRLLLGEDCLAVKEGRAFSIQRYTELTTQRDP